MLANSFKSEHKNRAAVVTRAMDVGHLKESNELFSQLCNIGEIKILITTLHQILADRQEGDTFYSSQE